MFPQRVFTALPTPVTTTPESKYTFYTYISTCSDTDKVFPGEFTGNKASQSKKVGIVVPRSIPHSEITYIYFHGNDELPVEDICNGSRYKICDTAVALGAPMIIPQTAVNGSSKKTTRTTKEEFECVMNEAYDVLVSKGISSQKNYIVAGHSGGAFTMSSYFIAGLIAQKAIVLDGCYVTDPPNPNPPANFCQDIIANFAGPVDYYYQTLSSSGETAGTRVETLKTVAIAHPGGALTAKKVNLTHYQLPTACLKDATTCENHVVVDSGTSGGDTSSGGASGGTSSGGTTAPKGPTYTGNELPIHTVELVNPIKGNVTDFRIIFGNVVQKLMAIIGAVTLVVFIIGGAYWLLSAGNPERVKKGTETMVWAAIGLFVVFGAYGILSAVIGGLTGRSVVDSGAPTNSSDVHLITGYVKIINQKTLIMSEPKSNVTAKGTLNPNTDCVPVTGKKQNGFSEVRDPKNLALYGWVLDGSIVQTTAQCGGDQSTAPSQDTQNTGKCVCTIKDDTTGDTSQTAIPNVDSPAECVTTSLQSPIVGTSISGCSWQTTN